MGNRKVIKYTDMASRIADNLMGSVFKRNNNDSDSDSCNDEKEKEKVQKSMKRKERDEFNDSNYTNTEDVEKDKC